jgi:hypothetical protein
MEKPNLSSLLCAGSIALSAAVMIVDAKQREIEREEDKENIKNEILEMLQNEKEDES